MSEAKGYKLTYFGLTGRGEPIRLAFAVAGIKFEDVRIEFKDWGKVKPTTPWGSLPVLETPSGDILTQCRALTRFVGKKAKLYPSDDLAAAKVDEMMDVCEDLGKLVNDTGKGMEKAEKEKARVESSTKGPIAAFLKKVDAYIAKNGKDGHVVGDKLTIADLFLFCNSSFLVCGFYDGMSKDVLKSYPNIQAVRKTVASVPEIQKRYENEKSASPVFKFFASAKDL
eukprot:CAMPEP_0114491304 /NCGR_PEP_ID=MMETSP0109-20121206/2926_1 /TAXON_ID=29199 /ORGANISM="Chlorarachnion reptans, Strain CCCM449" /LENGTH=225 /DNA_ID=CAMNT_0001668023 /DNA_START=113 /DNA_END=790 /DNA_ORIENTATION=+